MDLKSSFGLQNIITSNIQVHHLRLILNIPRTTTSLELEPNGVRSWEVGLYDPFHVRIFLFFLKLVMFFFYSSFDPFHCDCEHFDWNFQKFCIVYVDCAVCQNYLEKPNFSKTEISFFFFYET